MNLSEVRAIFFDDFGFCGCGSPESAAEYLLAGLAALKARSDSDWSDAAQDECNKFFPEYGRKAPEVFSLYLLDKAELIEHGGSISGSWLTEKGIEFLKAAKHYGTEQIFSLDDEEDVPEETL